MSSSRIGLGVFAAALFVRLAFLWDSADFPTFSMPVMDAASYHELALQWSSGGDVSTRLFWQPFFFPAWLTFLHALSGGWLLLPKLLHAIVGAFTCVLVLRLGTQLFGRAVGLSSAVVAMLYGPLLFFENQLMPTGWAAMWSVALVLLALRAEQSPSRGLDVGLGAAAALAVLTRPTFLPFAICTGAWLAYRAWRRRGPGPAAIRAGLLVAGFALTVLPVCAISQAHTDRFGFVPGSGGINLYIGNNPDFERTLTARRDDFRALVLAPRQHGAKDMWEEQQFFVDQVWAFAEQQPARFVGGLLHKTAQFFAAREIPRNVDLYVFRQWSPMLATLSWKVGNWAFPFGLLLPFAAVGLLLGWRRTPAPVRLMVALYPAAIVAVFACARYRVPLIPVLIPLAVHGAFAAVEIVRRGTWTRRVSAATVLLGATLLATVPGPFPEEGLAYEADLHFEIGTTLGQSGRGAEAKAHFARAIELAPDVDIHLNAAMNFMTLGENQPAAEQLRQGLSLAPDDPRLHQAMAEVLDALGQPAAAQRHREAAARAMGKGQ